MSFSYRCCVDRSFSLKPISLLFISFHFEDRFQKLSFSMRTIIVFDRFHIYMQGENAKKVFSFDENDMKHIRVDGRLHRDAMQEICFWALYCKKEWNEWYLVNMLPSNYAFAFQNFARYRGSLLRRWQISIQLTNSICARCLRPGTHYHLRTINACYPWPTPSTHDARWHVR